MNTAFAAFAALAAAIAIFFWICRDESRRAHGRLWASHDARERVGTIRTWVATALVIFGLLALCGWLDEEPAAPVAPPAASRLK